MRMAGLLFRVGVLLLTVTAGLLLSGCRSDVYYQNRAVERARKFLLENAPELTVEQIYFVRYNSPILLTAPILDHSGVSDKEKLSATQQQICVTWAIPGMDKYYLVFGSSSGRMAFWYPVRLIRKTFRMAGLPLDGAMKQARAFALDNLYNDMSIAEFNAVRFFYPYVIETNFEYVLDPAGTGTAESVEKTRAQLNGQKQYSLVWKFEGHPEAMVFCGGSAPDLSGWSVNFAGWMPLSELDAATVRVIRTPEDATTPIEDPQKKQPQPAAAPAKK